MLEVELVLNLVKDLTGDADAAGVGNGFQTRRDVNFISVNTVGIEDHVTLIDPDSERHAARGFDGRIPLRHDVLNGERAVDRI